MSLASTVCAWLRRPAVHFALVGLALFFGQRWLWPKAAAIPTMTEALRTSLGAEQAARLGRAPTREELERAVRQYLDDELLFRQALDLRLHESDPVVRRRLVQAMAFLLEADADEPTDADLLVYRDAHPEKYGRGETLSFTHRFFSSDRHADSRAAAVAALASGAAGDPFVAGQQIGPKTDTELDTLLGPGFAARLRQSLGQPAAGEWFGPVTSTYGDHLVRLSAQGGAQVPELAAVREALRRDLLRERRAEARSAALAKLRQANEP